jgi:hypothetical protein
LGSNSSAGPICCRCGDRQWQGCYVRVTMEKRASEKPPRPKGVSDLDSDDFTTQDGIVAARHNAAAA